jgi:methylase of polypeptide subunit release factors
VLRVLAAQVRDALEPDGAVFVELDPAQAEPVAAWLAAAGLRDVQTHRDMAGRARVVSARRAE